MARIPNYRILPDEPYGTYAAYLKANAGGGLTQAQNSSPKAIVDELWKSGLRGRGGAGFPTGAKWQTLLEHACPTRYVVCNAGEGEPGTFKDRYLLRRNPYAVLEGLYIAAHVIRAKAIYIGIKAAFRKEADRLEEAIREMRPKAGPSANVDIQVVRGPEEYLFGEEKAMLNYIESGLPLPREAHYPPYEKGLFSTPDSSNPALVNNAETFAHVPSIVQHGANGFRRLGNADTSGTILLTISGDVRRPGVYEVEAGIPIRKILDWFAGGSRNGIKAILPGFAAGVIPAERLDTPADFGSLSRIGSGLGSAGFIVLDNSRSMVRVAQAVARFLYVESCNQCPACKHGLRMSSQALTGMFDPEESQVHSVDFALSGAHSAPQANRCYLPVQGSVLIPSLIENFREEFVAQVTTPEQNPEVFPVPLILDFDETRQTILYDNKFARKNPDWTYSLPRAG
jgi:NADH:ubiquinone oxidoreductase subunit F (NADH-binding)